MASKNYNYGNQNSGISWLLYKKLLPNPESDQCGSLCEGCEGIMFVNNSKLSALLLFVQTCFDWFYKGQCDLEADTQSQMFTGKVLKLDPSRLTMRGMKNGR